MAPFAEGRKGSAPVEKVPAPAERPSGIQPRSFTETRQQVDEIAAQNTNRLADLQHAWSEETIPNHLLEDEGDFDNSDDEVDLGMATRMAQVEAEHYRLSPIDQIKKAQQERNQRIEEEMKMANALRIALQRASQLQKQISGIQRAPSAQREQELQSLTTELTQQNKIVDEYRAVLSRATEQRSVADQDLRTLEDIHPTAEQDEARQEAQRRLTVLAFNESQVDEEIQRLEQDIAEVERRRNDNSGEVTERLVTLQLSREKKQQRQAKLARDLKNLKAARATASSGFGFVTNRKQINLLDGQIKNQQAEVDRLDQEIKIDSLAFQNEEFDQLRNAGPWIIDQQRVDKALADALQKKQNITEEQKKWQEKLLELG